MKICPVGAKVCHADRHDEVILNANLMQQGNFIGIFLARHVSGPYAHHQEHYMLSCSIWFSAPSFWMGGGLESRCNSTSDAPDDGRMYPKHVELRIHQ